MFDDLVECSPSGKKKTNKGLTVFVSALAQVVLLTGADHHSSACDSGFAEIIVCPHSLQHHRHQPLHHRQRRRHR